MWWVLRFVSEPQTAPFNSGGSEEETTLKNNKGSKREEKKKKGDHKGTCFTQLFLNRALEIIFTHFKHTHQNTECGT